MLSPKLAFYLLQEGDNIRSEQAAVNLVSVLVFVAVALWVLETGCDGKCTVGIGNIYLFGCSCSSEHCISSTKS